MGNLISYCCGNRNNQILRAYDGHILYVEYNNFEEFGTISELSKVDPRLALDQK